RLIMDSLVRRGWLRQIKMLHLIGQTNINFLGVRWLAFGLSWLLIAVGVFWFVHRGGLHIGRGEVYGIDFAGGERVTLSFAQRVDPDRIRGTLEAGQVTDAYIQYASGGGAETLELKIPEGEGERVIGLLQQAHPEAQFKVIGTERVGAVIGAELLKQALIAVAMAMLAIMVYIAFRFGEFSYGVGALVALAHDVLMCIAWFCLTGRTFSVPVVAALLTVIGYSINDTIIIFDRIRENRKLRAGRLDYLSLINDSINQTLPRTILTAGTTLLTALSLYLFGGRVINDFAFCFLIGVITGTYSSIYIASPIVVWWHGETVPKAARKPVAA
ncbi:MAG: protein translocase subunit SecF, partial [Verrucomicrobiae bacterium]|nr:protein translocase subunit SecF [Verrucomicrobiae bacterium]